MENRRQSSKDRRKLLLGLALLFVVLMLVVELCRPVIMDANTYGEWIHGAATRFLGAAACVMMIISFDMGGILKFNLRKGAIAVFLPCMLIAVNNFPFIPFFLSEAYIGTNVERIALYAVFCISVGLFEELTFRGCIFLFVLQRRGKRSIDVFWSIVISSAIFAVVHLLNIAMGADPGATLLQIGYSFLIGGMCSVILVKTHNVWLCVILHAVYNFAGGIVPQCGGGEIWTLPEIILTAIISVLVAAYVIYTLVKISADDVDGIFGKTSNA